MKTLLTLLMATSFIGSFYSPTADAARVGGGRNTGIQRSVTPPPKAAPSAAPAAAAPAAAAAAGGNRWLGPIAGLAAGLGLGWLLSQGGFGGAMGGIILALLGAVVLFALLRIYSRRNEIARQMKSGGGQALGAQPLQYAGIGPQGVPAPQPASAPGPTFGGGASLQQPNAVQPNAVQPNIPAGFDVTGFVKQAKINFLRLQEANDRGDLDTLRDVCDDQMFENLKADVASRHGAVQHTQLDSLEATLIEVVSETDNHFASLSFCGASRDGANPVAQSFQEIWHLKKSVAGDTGWQLAGIQQVS